MANYSTLTDDELLCMTRSGDEGAFMTLYRRKQGGIYRFSLRMSGSETIAEDVTQEVFMTLMHDNGRFDASRGSIASYLFGIARYQVLKRIEKDRVLLSIDDNENERGESVIDHLVADNDPLSDLSRRETIDSVRQAILSLPPHYREALILCELHEMSYTEAAEVLGCAVGTVRSRLHRARAMLLERLIERLGPGKDGKASTGQPDLPPDLSKCYV